MKKNKMMRIASVLLVAVLLTTCAISGTFAKYASEFEASDTAHVAKWDVNVVEKGKGTFTFDLFNTIKDTGGTNDETDVAAGSIAPGTEGSFTITLSSHSEVTTVYTVVYAPDLNGVPIEFSVDGGENWTEDSITGQSGQINAGSTFSENIEVKWRWPFGADIDDNAHRGKSITVTATVNFTQVD